MTTRVRSDYLELVKRQPLVTIRSAAQYESALRILKELSIKDAKLSKSELDYFEVLGLLIKHYEEKSFRFTHPTAQDILRSFMQDHAMTQAAIAKIAGEHESNISAFFANRRNLGKRAILRLAKHFSVDPVLFLRANLERAG